MRVTDAQAATFAAYDEQDSAKVWYNDPRLLETPTAPDSRNDEFLWLRDLAADLLDERKAHAALAADYAACVRVMADMDRAPLGTAMWSDCWMRLRAALSSPRAVAVLKEGR
jgi:hypothetical protein